MCDQVQDKKRMKRIYPQTMNLTAVINDPRVMGIIKECGGKMYMTEKKWDKALDELFECFKYYQESGNIRAKTMLVYVILASMLCNSKINHADTREAKVYKDDKQIIAIMLFRQAFEKNDIKKITQVLQDKSNDLFTDNEFSVYLDDLLRNIRLNVLQQKVKPYRTVKLEFLAKEININMNEVKQLLSELILEERIDASIDQISGFIELAANKPKEPRFVAMENWSNTLMNIHMNLTHQNAY
jgi:COP9 signalosome complex subunit 2